LDPWLLGFSAPLNLGFSAFGGPQIRHEPIDILFTLLSR
jgi:hypothetical protein